MTIPDPRNAILPLAGSLLLVVGGCVSGPRPDLGQGAPPTPLPLDLPTSDSPTSRGERETGENGVSEAAARPSGPEEESESPGKITVDGDLTLDSALVTAILNNPGLEVARFGPRIAATAVPRELAAFDPRLNGSALYTDATQQLTAVQTFTFGDSGGDGAPEEPSFPNFLVTENLNLSTTVSTLFPTGTGLSLSGAVDRSDTNFTAEEYEGSWTLRLTQPLLEGRGREVNLIALRQAENVALRSEWQLRQAVLDLVLQVERTYWDLVLAQEVVGIREFGLRLATEQLELNRDLVDTGRAVPSAVLSARAEQASRRADLAEARGRVRALEVRLLRLLAPGEPRDLSLGRPGGEDPLFRAVDDPVVGRVEIDSETSVERALDHRPELVRERIEALNRRLDLLGAEDALGPDLNLVASYGRTSLGLELSGGLEHLADDSRFDNYTVGLELGLPLLGRGELARYRSARLSEMRAEAILRDTALAVAEEVRRAAIEVETQWLRIEATEEAVRSRREELRIEEDRYEVGMARNLDVLEVQRLLVQARVDAVTAKVRYLQALADLYRAEGTLLEHHGVTLADSEP